MWVLLPLSLLMRLWCRTLHIEISREERRLIADTKESVVLAFWHNRLFVAAECARRLRKGRQACGLVSASKDGAWLAAFFKLVGIEAVRGSSSNRGATALRELVAAVQSGMDVAITPDGPRGPCYTVKQGPVHVARRAGAPLLIASCTFHSAWRLKSWDGFYLPKPFSRMTLHCKQLPCVDSLGDDAARIIQAELMSITEDLQPADRSGVDKKKDAH